MKRRDAFKLVPVSLAGMVGLAEHASAIESMPRTVDRGEPLPVSLEYPRIIMNMAKWVKENQSDNMLEAAYEIARRLKKGGQFWINWDQGHSTRGEMFAGRHGMPEFMKHGYIPAESRDGDILMVSRILSKEGYEDLKKKDIFVIAAPSPWSGDAHGFRNVREDIQPLKNGDFADIWLENNITSIGAILNVPGMPAPIGPVSGPLCLIMMWMVLADVCRICSIEDMDVSVMGDEPKLKDNAKWINTRRPLAEDYYDIVERELGLIGAELGDIRKMAKMAVDTMLDGGTVYHYSRYRETYRGEATGRRGGLALARGLSDDEEYKLTKKDCVIMGVFQPDDPVDLKHLDKFKKAGVKLASIGPITRDFSIPDGRCVHKETEVHAGGMSDTYGLFAIPGIDKKVCPTTGISMIAMHWVLSIEIIDEIKARTGGNIPGVHYSGALKWGTDFNRRVRAMQQERGY